VDVLGIVSMRCRPRSSPETLERCAARFKNTFLSTLVETLAKAPQSATMTWLSETANEHVPGCSCPSFTYLMKIVHFKNDKLTNQA